MSTYDKAFFNRPEVREGLIQAGQQALEFVARDDDMPFAPMIGYVEHGQLHTILVAGDFEEHVAACRMLVEEGHDIDMIVHTVDSYHIKLPQDTPTEVAEDEYAGTLRQRFEDGDTRITEALHVTFVTKDEMSNAMLPYRRKGNRIIWRPDDRIDQVGLTVQGRYPDLFRITIEVSGLETA